MCVAEAASARENPTCTRCLRSRRRLTSLWPGCERWNVVWGMTGKESVRERHRQPRYYARVMCIQMQTCIIKMHEHPKRKNHLVPGLGAAASTPGPAEVGTLDVVWDVAGKGKCT